MNQSWGKKILLLLIVVIIAGVAYFIVINAKEKRIILQDQENMRQLEQLKINEDALKPSQKSEESSTSTSDEEDRQSLKELVGTITQVDVFDNDDGSLLLMVDADIADQSKMSNVISSNDGDEEVAMISKKFTVTVGKNVPIVGGLLDDLSEEDTISVISVEDIYSTTELTATNIEVL